MANAGMAAQIAKIIGAAFAAGIVIGLVILVVFFPISWVMNRFIYHHWIMRSVIGFMTLLLCPFAFVYILLFGSNVHYFTLLPLINADKILSADGWFTWLSWFINETMGPLLWSMENKGSAVGYEKTVGHMLVPAVKSNTDVTVPEEFLRKVKEAAAQVDVSEWSHQLGVLQQRPEAQRYLKAPSPSSSVVFQKVPESSSAAE